MSRSAISKIISYFLEYIRCIFDGLKNNIRHYLKEKTDSLDFVLKLETEVRRFKEL